MNHSIVNLNVRVVSYLETTFIFMNQSNVEVKDRVVLGVFRQVPLNLNSPEIISELLHISLVGFRICDPPRVLHRNMLGVSRDARSDSY